MDTSARTRPSPIVRWTVLFAVAAALVFVYYTRATAGANPGWDFEHYYAGAQIVRAGLGHRLYDIDVQHVFETRYGHGAGAVFNYPAATVLLYWPVAFLPLNAAFLVWTAVSMAITMIAVWILARSIGIADPWWPMLLSMGLYPLQWSLVSGQVDSVVLLAFVLALAAMTSGRPLAAGFALALALIKFHLVLPFVFVLLLRKQWRMLLGFVGGSTMFIGLCAAISGAEQFTAYPRLLMTMQSLANGGFDPRRMPNIRGLVYLVTGRDLSLLVLVIIALAVLTWTALRSRSLDLDSAFALSLTAALVTTYHLYVYDLALLLIPLAVLAIRTPPWTTLKIAVFALIAVPLLPWFAIAYRISAVVAVPSLLLFWALATMTRSHISSYGRT